MKIALVMPASRRWGWHEQLEQALAAEGEVTTFLVRSAPYPQAIRHLLAVEQKLFGTRPQAVRLPCAEPIGAPAIDPSAYDVVLDLAGAAPMSPHRLAFTYDGEADEAFLWGSLLRGRSPVLAVRSGGAPRPLVWSYAALDDAEVLSRAAATVFSRLIALAVRAVRRHGRPVLLDQGPPPDRRAVKWSARAVLGFAARQVAIKLLRNVRKPFVRERHWSVALRRALPPTDGGAPQAGAFTVIRRPMAAYYADPFLFSHQGRVWLLVEGFPYRTGLGFLAATEIDAETGKAGEFETIMERPYHLSYPQVFAHGEAIYMLPETGKEGRLKLFRAVDFPRSWTEDRVLMDVSIADATLFEHGGRWWLMGTVALFGGSSRDELFAFHAPSPFGPWTEHAGNPIKSDARSARPAGRVIEREGRLFRPTQDCEGGYGAGISWCEILELTPESFRERVIAHWEGKDFGRFTGVHTYNAAGGFEVIDLKSDVRR